MICLLLTSTLFPYTTLFRSRTCHRGKVRQARNGAESGPRQTPGTRPQDPFPDLRRSHPRLYRGGCPRGSRTLRSEEHTSELQSPCKLVCRLLLEKKKANT